MEQINLPEFLSLFGCNSVDDCWLNADCLIDESGIKTRHIAKHSDEDYIERTNYSLRVELSFPCTAQRIFDWAQLLDSWERFKAVGNQNHVVEKLPKEIVDKWQPVNELYRGWCDAKGVIKKKIGTEPFDVNWDYWLSLSKWTKKEAALLISGVEPDKFHLVERDADFQSMCEPLVKLLRQIPDDLTQCPFDWLNWFDEIGNLMYAPKALLVWFEQQSGIVALQAEPVANVGTGKNESRATTEWKKTAREIGESWMNEQRKEGKDPGVIEIAKHVEGEMSNRGITGTRGKFLDFETIKREALTGITGKPANGKGQKKRKQIGESPV
jgi:hypothetical protein